MALNIIDEMNSRLKFLHRQNRCLTSPLLRLLCTALIQRLSDFGSTDWFSNLSKRLKLHVQALQNKGIRICLQLDKRSKICVKEFLQLNWLNFHDRYLQFIVSDIFKFQNEYPDYFDELFCFVGENSVITRSSNKTIKKNKARNAKLILCGT